jgi:hypothetical protein
MARLLLRRGTGVDAVAHGSPQPALGAT